MKPTRREFLQINLAGLPTLNAVTTAQPKKNPALGGGFKLSIVTYNIAKIGTLRRSSRTAKRPATKPSSYEPRINIASNLA